MADFKTLIKQYERLFNKTTKMNSFSRLGRVFSTEEHSFYYDTGTGKVLEISYSIALILKQWADTNLFNSVYLLDINENLLLDSLSEIFDAAQTENLFSAAPLTTLIPSDFDLTLSEELTSLTLEVTEKCNLRCKYCIYQDPDLGSRGFGSSNMSWEVARHAIDIFLEKSKETIFVAFYGGEPLLNFDLIVRSVEYITQKCPNKKIRFATTTNGTLITPEIAKFFADIKDFIVTFSIDGPKEVHDENRISATGKGSFSDALHGLKLQVEANRISYNNPVNINMVIADPKKSTLTKLQSFIENISWLPETTNITMNYVSSANKETAYQGVDGPDEVELLSKYKKGLSYVDPVMGWGLENFDKMSEEKLTITKDSINKELLSIHTRPISDVPCKFYSMNSCCVPGARRLYVDVQGNFKPCEKIGPCPSLGNTHNGLNLPSIKKHYLYDYIDEAVKYCGECWAINLCSLCYLYTYDENGINFSYKHHHCRNHRVSLEASLVAYHTIALDSPDLLNYLNKMSFS